MAIGKYDLALDDCAKALQIDPSNIMAYNNRAVIYEEKGEYEKARENYLLALDIEPNNTKIRNNLEDLEKRGKKG